MSSKRTPDALPESTGDARDRPVAGEPAPWMQSLAITRLDLTLVPAAPWTPPPHPTVTLRGALGKAVMAEVCDRTLSDCRACDRVSICVVPTWFDPGRAGAHAQRPLVVEVGRQSAPEASQPLLIRWWITGPVPVPELLVNAVFRMAAEGLGTRRVPHEVVRLHVRGAERSDLLAGGRWSAPGSLAAFVRMPVDPLGARVRLRTPARWKGVSSDRVPGVADLVRAAVQRVRSVAAGQGVSVDRWWPSGDNIPGRWEHLAWHDDSRYSSRQDERVDLSGWTGVLRLGPEVAGIADLLAAAEVLHVGSSTNSGAGRVTVQWAEGGGATDETRTPASQVSVRRAPRRPRSS